MRWSLGKKYWASALALVALSSACVTPRPISDDPMEAYPLGKLERRLIADAKDRSLDEFSLLDAALLASGVESRSELKRWRAEIDPYIDHALLRVRGARSDVERGKILLQALHQELLGRYREGATSLLVVAKEHRFNCVSATVIFNEAAQRAGLLVKAVILPTHVFSVQFTAQGPIEVETTTPQGYAPDRRSRSFVAFLAERGLNRGRDLLGGGSAGAGTALESAEEIDNITLVSLVLSNLSLDAYVQAQTTRARALLHRARLLAGEHRSAQLRAHEAALVNTLVLQVASQGQYQRAIDMIDMSWADAPPASRQALLRNRAYCIDKLATAQRRSGQFRLALQTYTRGLDHDSANQILLHNRRVLLNDWAIALGKQERERQAVEVYQRGVNLYPGDALLTQNLTITLSNAAARAYNRKNCNEALYFVEKAHALQIESSLLSEVGAGCAARGVTSFQDQGDASPSVFADDSATHVRPSARLGLCP